MVWSKTPWTVILGTLLVSYCVMNSSCRLRYICDFVSLRSHIMSSSKQLCQHFFFIFITLYQFCTLFGFLIPFFSWSLSSTLCLTQNLSHPIRKTSQSQKRSWILMSCPAPVQYYGPYLLLIQLKVIAGYQGVIYLLFKTFF